jgi:succinoglycan biosynthesis transport protein ExoP
MIEQPQALELRSYLKILSRRRWIILATFLTVVASTALVTWRLTPEYEGMAKVRVLPASSSDEASRLLESVFDPTSALQTEVEIVQSEEVLGRAARELRLPSTEELTENVSVELVADTQIMEIRVRHERPDEARDRAQVLAESYINFRRDESLEKLVRASEGISVDIEDVKAQIAELDQRSSQSPELASSLRAERDRAIIQLSTLESTLRQLPEAEDVREGGGSIITPAALPTDPVSPKKALNLVLALVVGVVLGLGLALIAENLDDRLKSPEDVEKLVGAPILGYIPLVKEWKEGQPKVATLTESASGAAEAYRTLKTNLRFVSLERPLRTILVTSPVAEAGKSTSAANLATALAQGGSKVVLVSGDLRRPSVHKFFGLTNSKGLLDLLNSEATLEEALQKGQVANLRLLATGGLPPNPTEILGSERFASILESLRSLADFVIIDAPPVLGLGDTSAMASKVDGVLMVVRTNLVTKREVAHATDQLRKAGGKVVGCILNAVEANDGYGYYYQYYYTNYNAPSTNGSEKKSNAKEDQKRPANPELADKAGDPSEES